MTASGDPVIQWLLDGDPAIRWQVLRDLLGASEASINKERQRITKEGWGARLLAEQDASGTWCKGLYNPKWTSTTYTMLLLRDFGLPPSNEQAHQACALLLDNGLKPDGGVNYGPTPHSETCITGMVLSILSYCQHDDKRLETIVAHLLGQQMPDGGWNCRLRRGATHASVHTTISVLEGLRQYELNGQRNLGAVRAAQQRAREFLLVHRLHRSHRTGAVIRPEFKRFSFPPRWHYDILRALDYFQSVKAPRDPRLEDAIDIVRTSKNSEGYWLLANKYNGKTHFELERLGKPSRWNTLRALRVLKWWDAQPARRARP